MRPVYFVELEAAAHPEPREHISRLGSHMNAGEGPYITEGGIYAYSCWSCVRVPLLVKSTVGPIAPGEEGFNIPLLSRALYTARTRWVKWYSFLPDVLSDRSVEAFVIEGIIDHLGHTRGRCALVIGDRRLELPKPKKVLATPASLRRLIG